MRLLLVFPFLPYPPDDGGRIGFWNPIKYLSRQHEVHVAFLAEDADREHWKALEEHCASVQALFRVRPNGLFPKLRALVAYPPGTAGNYWDPRFTALLQKIIRDQKIDLIEFHHLHMAAYRDAAGKLPTVLREHNVEYVIWERHARYAPLFERVGAQWLAPRMRRYEAGVAARFDRCVVVSPADEAYLRRVSPFAHVEMIPSGVDTEYFSPKMEILEESNKMVLTGSFAWPPKQHNLRVILEDIMPRIVARVPDAQLCVVGKGVPANLARLAARTRGVILTGAVTDVRPFVHGASLILNYLESGGGIALKVLEAFAMRKAVLSNRLGCEGIEVEHGKQVFLAEGPDSFAAAAARLLSDAPLRTRLADGGYDLIQRKYAWSILAAQFDAMYRTVLQNRNLASLATLSV